MKPCLEDSELLHLLAADAGDNADHRQHLTECSRCAARYEEAVREAGMITSALTHAADHLISRKRAAEASAYEPFGDRFRLAAIFSGAAAFGGAAAFALLLTLGWRPVSVSNRLAQVASNTAASGIASVNRDAARGRTVASSYAGNSLPATGALYAAEALTNDPLAGLVYGDSLSAANANANEDLLFCVPEEDGAICSTSAEQG
jgi:hypothetical protein